MRPNSQKKDRETSLATLIAGNYGLVTRNQLRRLGYSDSNIQRMVSAGRLERFLPGVFRSTTAAITWEMHAMAGTLRSPGNVWLSHRSAAAHHGLTGCRKDHLEFLSTRQIRSTRGHQIHHVAEMPICDVESIRGIAVTTPARTLLDLASVVDEETLEIALDDALFTRQVRLPRLRWRLNELGTHGKPGIAKLRRLLEIRGDAIEVPTTILETKLVRLLRRGKLPVARPQHRIHENGKLVARVDFMYPEQRVVIEVDGARWHMGRRARVKDAERDNYLNIRGWTVLRFSWFDLVERPEYVLDQIRRALGIHPLFVPE
jgi:very-short-patch-repair endonuclease